METLYPQGIHPKVIAIVYYAALKVKRSVSVLKRDQN